MEIKTTFDKDEEVYDTLTQQKSKIIGITFSHGFTKGNKYRDSIETIGYWLDNDWLDGGRHPWEISKLK